MCACIYMNAVSDSNQVITESTDPEQPFLLDVSKNIRITAASDENTSGHRASENVCICACRCLFSLAGQSIFIDKDPISFLV